MSSLGTRDTVTRLVTSSASVSRIRLRERDLVTRELHDGDEDTRLLGNTGSEASDVVLVLLALDDDVEVLVVAGVWGGSSLIASPSLFSSAP